MGDAASTITDRDSATNAISNPRLVIDAAEAFNYAAWQNSVPLLRELNIENEGETEFNTLEVALQSSSGFVKARRWAVDRINAGETLAIRDIDLDVDAEYLNRLDEAERGVLTFRLLQRGAVLHEVRVVLRVLARDEWGGLRSMAELLPAFVTPNDPALPALLKSASKVLEEHGEQTSLEGYQSNDANRVYVLAASVWSAIAGRGLVYANPPGSFEQVGQKVRRAGVVLTDGLATCLDSTLLFASALEAIGLHPVVVLMSGHCFVGVWLVEKAFSRLVEPDCSEVRKALSAHELIVFETTLVTNSPAPEFPAAIATAVRAISPELEHEFEAAIDVARARLSQIRPLASHVAREVGLIEDVEWAAPRLAVSPGFRPAAAVSEEVRPRTPEGRIERWQRKLLDLSLRNRLLNFRPSKQTAPVLCPDVSRLEDHLADGGRLRLVSLSDANPRGQRDARLHEKRTQKDLDWEFARHALDRDELVCPLELNDLNARLTALYRKVQNDLSEGGSNTLYLSVGFLRWKQSPLDEAAYLAPLLLVPVKLLRRSATSPFYLTSYEDEVRFNATLVQLLKKDFACDLSEFESNLPTDDSGVNVPLVLDRMRQAVRDIPGFEVVEEAAISPFSFAKYLMWRDLVDRVGKLSHNRVVRHLIHDPEKAFANDAAGPMPRPHEIDTRYQPADIVHPLPADSSQLAAVMAASEGHDMVIVGPPGTGKSQTIANLIAQCLSVGKTVLFVAEKTAALNVVHRRLREHGLGDCCIELHSNKAERRRFFDQLEASWKNRSRVEQSEWVTICEQLRVRRDQLNAYAAAVHTPESNGWTPYRAMGTCVRGGKMATPRLDWPAEVRHDDAQYKELQACIAGLAASFTALPADGALPRVQVYEWSMAWETALLEACRQLESAAGALASALTGFAGVTGLSSLTDISSTQLKQVYDLARELARPAFPSRSIVLYERLESLQAALVERRRLLAVGDRAGDALEASLKDICKALGGDWPGGVPRDVGPAVERLAEQFLLSDPPPAALVFHPRFEELVQTLEARPALLEEWDRARESLLARSYSAALIDRIDVEGLDREWSAACSALWPMSIFRRRATVGKFMAYITAGGSAAPDIDLPLMREFRDCRSRLAENLTALGLPMALQVDVEKKAGALEERVRVAGQLRQAIRDAGFSLETFGNASAGTLESLTSLARRIAPARRELEAVGQQLQRNLNQLGLPPSLLTAVENDVSTLDSQVQAAGVVRQAIAAFGFAGDRQTSIIQAILSTPEKTRVETSVACCGAAKAFQTAWAAYQQLARSTPAARESTSVVSDAATAAGQVLTRRGALKHWTAWLSARKRAEALGLSTFVEALESGDVPATEAVDRFQLAYARWWLPHIVDRRAPLRTFQRFLHEDAIEEFRRLDEEARRASAPRARQAVLHDLPSVDQVPRKSELGLLRHQMTLKRPSKSIRETIAGIPDSFSKLAPCLLMSPLSIAQYLPAELRPFDVVVFDEASQIATWDAIGAIARGKQTIIVGDPKQLPPTNFFGRAESDEGNAELEDYEKDLESILDEAHASGLPTVQLNWHYRSRHESLIAFSNWNYYGNRLVTFPAAESVGRGVSLRQVEGGVYDRGKSRTNRREAEAIVADAVERMLRCLKKPAEERLTYGVVTFNGQQQELLQDLFDEAQRRRPELEWFFSDERIEPTVVKNLENVQGDERDVMLFSITFGRDAAGKFPVDFGAINRDGGERRLNVAVTRAKQELIVYASFAPDQLRAERSSARGVHDLKAFLEYAERGPKAIIERSDGSLGGYESPLEEAIAAALEERGWRVETQIGVSGFRIDLGIVHPDKPGTYLAGVECDGATYHRSAVARDRDKTRRQVLEGLGWKILRIWSTDWWYDPETALSQVDIRLNELLKAAREVLLVEAAFVEPSGCESRSNRLENDESDGPGELMPQDGRDEESLRAGESSSNLVASSPFAAELARQPERRLYARVNLTDATAEQHRFFEDGYSERLRSMALSLLESHGPIREDEFVRQVARAHGFGRTSARIRQRVLELIPGVASTHESVGRFLWPGVSATDVVPFRYAVDDGDRRSIEQIAMPELLGLARQLSMLLAASDDPALTFAREMGLSRLARPARGRLEEALEALRGNDL